MNLIFTVIKKASLNYWEEMFFLTAYNIFTFFMSALPFVVVLYGSLFFHPIYFIPFGSLLIVLISPLIMGMFGAAHEISIGKAISMRTYFDWAKRLWREGMIWGAINLAAAVIFYVNITFYGNIQEVWALYASSFMIGLAMMWFMSQVFALTFYAKLEKPSFRLATRNGLVIIAKKPLLTISITLICFFLIFSSSFVPYFVVFITFALVALVIDTTTAEVITSLDKERK